VADTLFCRIGGQNVDVPPRSERIQTAEETVCHHLNLSQSIYPLDCHSALIFSAR